MNREDRASNLKELLGTESEANLGLPHSVDRLGAGSLSGKG